MENNHSHTYTLPQEKPCFSYSFTFCGYTFFTHRLLLRIDYFTLPCSTIHTKIGRTRVQLIAPAVLILEGYMIHTNR